jgi:NitT/TauT family transport system permease protein
MKELFELRGQLKAKTHTTIEIIGFLLFITIWQGASMYINSGAILPSPWKVICAFKELHFEDFLVINTWYSIKLNYLGYIEAVLLAIPVGMTIGLFPLFSSLSGRYIDAIRFIPLTAVTGLFIVWFGIEATMKVQFLSFGIFVYLLPVVVLRTSNTDEIYKQTAYTLGATKWQTIKSVFIPDVLSKVFDDIRVLVAISWTYIIVAELINQSGGIGAMIYKASRASRLDKVFAILIVIIIIGFLQDKLFKWLDRRLFPHKYRSEKKFLFS